MWARCVCLPASQTRVEAGGSVHFEVVISHNFLLYNSNSIGYRKLIKYTIQEDDLRLIACFSMLLATIEKIIMIEAFSESVLA